MSAETKFIRHIGSYTGTERDTQLSVIRDQQKSYQHNNEQNFVSGLGLPIQLVTEVPARK